MDFILQFKKKKITLMKMLATDILEMYHENFTIAKIKILISITLLLNLG